MKFSFLNIRNGYLAILLMVGSIAGLACQESATTTNSKNNDSTYSGLEGTREEASQATGSTTIDTSSGQTIKKQEITDSIGKNSKDSANRSRPIGQ